MEVSYETLDNSRYCAKHTFSLHASDISTGELNTSPKLGAYSKEGFSTPFFDASSCLPLLYAHNNRGDIQTSQQILVSVPT